MSRNEIYVQKNVINSVTDFAAVYDDTNRFHYTSEARIIQEENVLNFDG